MKPSKNFYQWDINQKFTECDGRFVDFIINEKVIYRVDIVNGECIIPDEFLQKSGYHTVYECMSDYTIQNHMFPVHPREKPPAYVYTPTEKLTFEGLVQKVNDTVADIIRRADSGEFDGYTPVKGKDYFTEAEKSEMVESVASGAIGEFREVVDSATADFNENSSVKTNDYNTNAEKKLDVYNSNAAEKFQAYNDNHVEKMTTYDTNDEQHTTDYNRNAEQKLEAYNQNHTEKVEEYNQNAAALQTEVDRLRGKCDNLAAENRKQENRISALMKLNKGQTYDILPEEGETASRTAPSGAKYVSVDKVGGKSIVEAGAIVSSTTAVVELEGKNLWDDSDPAFMQVLLNAGFLYNSGVWNTNSIVFSSVNISTIPQQSVLSYDILANTGLNPRIELFSGETKIMSRNLESTGKWIHHNLNIPSGTVIDRIVVDYASRGMCKIKNIQLERGTTETAYSPHTNQSLSTGFPELNSAGTAHDVIDLDGGAIRRNVGTVDLGSLTWDNNGTFEDGNVQFIAKIPGRAYTGNGLCDRFEKSEDNALGTYTLRTTGDQITFAAPEGTEINAFIESVNGATLYYELATPTTEPVTIPEALQEWLPVEPGGTVTFKNADESKQLPVPNVVSWVRKLNEVN